jgi:hypothetical protein
MPDSAVKLEVPAAPRIESGSAAGSAHPPVRKDAEKELDTLLELLKRRAEKAGADAAFPAAQRDPLQSLRELTVTQLVPVFSELVEKYSRAGITMQMDASNLLDGGREIKFEFGIGDFRSRLDGTATGEGIAFHQTRYSPDCHGEFSAGPMLRLRNLTANGFREFICERLTLLLRLLLRRK